jgi:hypothetical protein
MPEMCGSLAYSGGNLAFALYGEAEALADVDLDRALAESLELSESVGNLLTSGISRTSAVSLRGRHGDPHAAAFSPFPHVLRHWRASGAHIMVLTTLRNLVPLLVRAGYPDAVELAAALDMDTTRPSYGDEARRLEEAVRAARDQLGVTAYGVAVSAGRSRDLPAAVDRALAVLDRLSATAGPCDPVRSGAPGPRRPVTDTVLLPHLDSNQKPAG